MQNHPTIITTETLKQLSQPMPLQHFGIKIQAFYESKAGKQSEALIACYIDARAVQSRLNSVIGPGNWSFRWETAAAEGKSVVVRGKLTVLGTVHEDVGTGEGIEAWKSAVSDALKRCAVHFGIGAYLYDIPKLHWPAEGNKQHARLVEEEKLLQQMHKLSLEVYEADGDLSGIDLRQYRYTNRSSSTQSKEEKKTATPEQVKAVTELVNRKLAKYSDQAEFLFSKLHRTVKSIEQITQSEAKTLIKALQQLPDLKKKEAA